MSKQYNWFKEWFRAWFVCKHENSTWELVDLGRKKVRYCDSCSRGLEVI